MKKVVLPPIPVLTPTPPANAGAQSRQPTSITTTIRPGVQTSFSLVTNENPLPDRPGQATDNSAKRYRAHSRPDQTTPTEGTQRFTDLVPSHPDEIQTVRDIYNILRRFNAVPTTSPKICWQINYPHNGEPLEIFSNINNPSKAQVIFEIPQLGLIFSSHRMRIYAENEGSQFLNGTLRKTKTAELFKILNLAAQQEDRTVLPEIATHPRVMQRKRTILLIVESDIDPKILPKDYQHGALLGVHSYDIGVEDEGFFALLKLLGCNELVEIHDGANHPVIAKILAEEKRLRTPLISWPLTADEPDSLSISFEEWLAAK